VIIEQETVMKRMLVAVVLALVPLTIPTGSANARPSKSLALPAPPPETCIVILGHKICW
jgi:hypothetical protein